MPSKRKFHRYVFKIEVLSEDELAEDMPLSDLEYAITEGHCSGRSLECEHEELDGPQCAKALIEQGSDPEFFMLTEDGEDTEETMTNEQKTTYLERRGGSCPYCGSESIEAANYENEGLDRIYQGVSCLVCNKEWTDIYTLTGVEPVE